jgi:tetratricopeptide (TPR) repeat protein
MRKALFVVLALLFFVAPALADWQADARAALTDREYQKAVDIIAKSGDVTTADGLLMRGEAYFEMGRVLDAEKDVTSAVKLDEGHAAAQASLALIYAKQRAVDLALTHAEKAVELQRTADTLYSRGVVYLGAGRIDEALTDIEAAIALNGKNPDFHRARGAILRYRSKFDEAMTEFNLALKFDKKPYKVYLETASLHVLRGNPVDAKGDIDKAVNAAPELYYGYLGRAAVKEAYGEMEAALTDYTKAIQLAPQVAELYFNQANLLVGLKRVQQADQVLTAGKPYCEDIPDWYVMVSLVQSTLGKQTEALATLDELIRRTPTEWQGYTLRGQLHGSTGDFEKAQADFDKAIQIDPEAAEPQLNKAKLLMAQKDADGALAILNAMIAKHPDAPALYQMRMQIYETLGKTAAALADLNKAQELKKQQPTQ